jgi:hypothetical protein
MADNENKIVLNVPGQANVDPSEVTQESLKDPLSGRDTDTDTGSLARLDDTRTRKTIKIKPSSNTGPVPVINIGAAVPPPAVSTESGRVSTASARISDVLAGRDTDTGNLAKMDDTKTRKTVKLAPLSAAGPVPVIKLGTVSSPINTESMPIAPDDTRTRQTVVLKSAPGAVAAPSHPTESALLSDVLTGRDTDTGNLDRMDDTKTRKTIKLTPLTAGGPIPKVTPLTKPPVPGTDAPAVPPANFAATVELTPVVMPIPGTTAPGIPTDTGSLRGVLGDTSTRRTVKINPPVSAAPPANFAATVELTPVVMPISGTTAPGIPTDTGSLRGVLGDTSTRRTVKINPPVSAAPPANFAATVELTPVVIPVPGNTEPGVSTDTGSLRGVLEDTSTRKTVKISPLPEPSAPSVKENNDDTVKLQRTKPASVPPPNETVSPLPVVAQAKAVVPGSKQTIKLRPSTGSSVPPEESVPAPAKLTPAAATSKDTIKLTSSTASSAPVAASAPTINLTGSTTPPPVLGAVSSAPTVNMGIKPPTPAAGLAPSSPTVNLSAPSGLSLKKPALTPSSPPPAEQKPGLSLPGKAPAVKPPEPAAEEPAAMAEEAGGEVVEEEKKGGLQIKKRGAEEEPQGPPRVQTDLDKIAKGPVTAEGQPSMLYFALALVSVICLLLSVYITAAQYINLWEQARVKTKLPVPFLSEIVK